MYVESTDTLLRRENGVINFCVRCPDEPLAFLGSPVFPLGLQSVSVSLGAPPTALNSHSSALELQGLRDSAMPLERQRHPKVV